MQPIIRPFSRLLCLSVSIILLAGCQGEGPKVGLKSDDPAGRMIAMKQAGQRRDAKAVPALVEGLSSDDPAERFYASEALERITGQTLGYHYYDSESAREQAVQNWKQWLNGRTAAGTTKAK
jgi:hypothetical protein